MKIGFIGIGIMGLPMVRHLKKANHQISIYNRTFDKIKDLKDKNMLVIKNWALNGDVLEEKPVK